MRYRANRPAIASVRSTANNPGLLIITFTDSMMYDILTTPITNLLDVLSITDLRTFVHYVYPTVTRLCQSMSKLSSGVLICSNVHNQGIRTYVLINITIIPRL